MARKNTSNVKNKTNNKKQADGLRKSKTTGSSRSLKSKSIQRNAHLVDARSRRDLRGIVFIVLAIVLFIAAVIPQNAVVTKFIYDALHLSLGIGAYLLPVFLLGIGLCYILRQSTKALPARVSIGLAMIFVALLTILALNTPGCSEGSTAQLFISQNLTSLGGYLGAGFAWCGVTLFGKMISIIIMVGIIIAGFVVIGLSLNGLIETIKDRRRASIEESALAGPEFARFKKGTHGFNQEAENNEEYINESDLDPSVSAAPTALIDRRKSNRSADTSSAVTVAFDKDVNTRDTFSFEDNPRPLTRKLGKRTEQEIIDETVDDPFEDKDDLSAQKEMNDQMSAKEKSVKLKKVPTIEIESPASVGGFVLPDMAILHTSKVTKKSKAGEAEYMQTAEVLQETLEDFGVFAKVVGWVAGPTVTLYKVDLPAGTRVSKVTSLSDDIARSLAASGVRIFAPIPGTTYVGIEVPNQTRQTVLLGDVLPHAGSNPLEISIGKDVEGNYIVSDLAKMPHLLIGGTTGSGKSVSINGMIMSILMRTTPAEVRLILIDPKRVEFTPYNGIPHLYVPVVTEPKEAASALSWAVAEMERRLKLFSKVGARNISQYNAKIVNGEIDPEQQGDFPTEIPYIVVVIDELADLMMNCGKEVEYSISRIAQLARAAGIHLIIATQRPSANVVTGLIKANITSRIALNVATGIDSRVILDQTGAEALIGNGDLLFSQPEFAKPLRVQGCYVSEDEIFSVVEHLKEQGEPDYHNEILQTNLITLGASSPDGSGGSCGDDDPLLWEAAEIVVSNGLGSTSNIQRRLKVGYSRAGRIMDMLEEKGIVGPQNGSKPREVLVDSMELEALKAFEANDR